MTPTHTMRLSVRAWADKAELTPQQEADATAHPKWIDVAPKIVRPFWAGKPEPNPFSEGSEPAEFRERCEEVAG